MEKKVEQIPMCKWKISSSNESNKFPFYILKCAKQGTNLENRNAVRPYL